MLPIAIMAMADDDDRDFMTQLFIKYCPLMRKHAYAIINNYNDIDDIIQEACLKLVSKVTLLRSLDGCTLPSYIVSTIRRVSIDLIKRRDVAGAHSFLGEEEDAAALLSDLGDDYDLQKLVALRADNAEVMLKLRQLPEREQAILNYKYLLELSDKEIAKIIGIDAQSVRQCLTRARRHALEILMEGGVESAASI